MARKTSGNRRLNRAANTHCRSRLLTIQISLETVPEEPLPILPATQTKKLLRHYLLLDRGMKAIAHEYRTSLGNCDLFAVDRLLFGFEYEIKMAKADLRSELQIIRKILGGVNPRQSERHVSGSKSQKHEQYLNHPHETRFFVPNFFYFVVPPTLVEEAVQGVQGTRYGVISFEVLDAATAQTPEELSLGYRAFVPRRPTRLHDRTMEAEDLLDVCSRLCWVAYNAVIDPHARVIK